MNCNFIKCKKCVKNKLLYCKIHFYMRSRKFLYCLVRKLNATENCNIYSWCVHYQEGYNGHNCVNIKLLYFLSFQILQFSVFSNFSEVNEEVCSPQSKQKRKLFQIFLFEQVSKLDAGHTCNRRLLNKLPVCIASNSENAYFV